MTAKEKYLALLSDVVANEAISKDKLKLLIKKYGTNKDKTIPWLRKGGVLEDMGQDVNRVLIKGKDLEGYAEWLAWQASPKKKAEKIDMSLPGKWTSTEDHLPYEVLDMPDTDAAEDDIDMHSRVLGMMQTNTKKQNEYISELEKRIRALENRMDMCGEEIEGLDDKIDSLEDRMKEQTLIGSKNGMLKALHQLLGELI